MGSGGVLEATPTYDIIELIKYISWVVTKPAANYDDWLIPSDVLGDFDGYSPEEESVSADSPSEQTDTQATDTGDTPPPPPGQYTPIGRMGLGAGETVFKDGDYWEWDAEYGTWILDRGANGRRDYID